jgi:acyl transferase domain-containing protein
MFFTDARGEGVAAVVLKPLSAAIEDGDVIECIIREVGVNQDGKTRGITMPSAQAQASLIRQTYAKAGLDPSTQEGRCQFFEAHGTGTPAGDPQEAEALKTAFFPDGPDSLSYKEFSGPENLLVGSIKTVIGHTEGTAGLAGLLKACMALKHGSKCLASDFVSSYLYCSDQIHCSCSTEFAVQSSESRA